MCLDYLIKHIYIYTYIKVKVKLTTIVEGDPKAPFSIATTPRSWGGPYSTLPLPYNVEC